MKAHIHEKPQTSSLTLPPKKDRASLVAQMIKNPPVNAGDAGSKKIPWRRKWQPTPVFLPGKSHDKGAWQATVHGVAKSQTRLSK